MRLFALLTLSALAVGCDTHDGPGGVAHAPETAGRDLSASFEHAAQTYDVPAELLMAVAHAETGLQMVVGHEEFEGRPAAFGLMGLRDHIADEAASLAGVDGEQARFDAFDNVAAAAAWMSASADLLGVDRTDLAAWAPVVAAYSDIDNAEAQAAYVHREVYGVFARGAAAEGLVIPRRAVTAAWALPADLPDAGVLGVGDATSIWTPSPNYNSRSGASADFVIIHTCEGTYSGCWGWLTNPSAGVSAHYVVNDDGSEIRQLVDESDRAWHISASYDCANNSSVECTRNGSSMNTISVGIEHAGFASQTVWDDGLLDRSAALTCGITQRQGIVRDGYHIVAHGQLQPWNRTDPGPNWPWTDYLQRVDVACGGTGPVTGDTIIIDSNNSANVPGETEMVVSANWTSSTNTPGYYNTGYWVAPTEAISDAARFRFNLTAESCFEVQAWWSADTDRAPSATFLWRDDNAVEIGRQSVDQRVNGGRWNSLGLGVFPPGWNEVLLSRWTTVGAWVVADAVRLVETDACPGWTPPGPDSDGDGTPDDQDGCVDDANKIAPGDCGCGVPDEDITGDGISDCTTCGDGVIEAPETCDDGARDGGDGCSEDCAVETLTFDPVAPGVAGVSNGLSTWNGTPGETVWHVLSWKPGWTEMPGCPGVWVPVADPVVIGSAVNDAQGHAELSVVPPASAAGKRFYMFAAEAASCRVTAGQIVRF